jgi:hypothetical protein
LNFTFVKKEGLFGITFQPYNFFVNF